MWCTAVEIETVTLRSMLSLMNLTTVEFPQDVETYPGREDSSGVMISGVHTRRGRKVAGGRCACCVCVSGYNL